MKMVIPLSNCAETFSFHAGLRKRFSVKGYHFDFVMALCRRNFTRIDGRRTSNFDRNLKNSLRM